MKERTILGLTEDVIILGKEQRNVIARIDSGATSSSIDKELAEMLDLGPEVRTKLIKSASGVGKRPIIKVGIKLHGKLIEDEFSIADRSHMTYPILIGQNVLKKGKFLIDPLKEAKQK